MWCQSICYYCYHTRSYCVPNPLNHFKSLFSSPSLEFKKNEEKKNYKKKKLNKNRADFSLKIKSIQKACSSILCQSEWGRAFIQKRKLAVVLTTLSVSPRGRTALSIVPVELLNYLLMNNGISLWLCSYNPILFLCFLLGVQIQSPLAALQIIRSCHTCWWLSLRRSMPCQTRLSPTATSRLWPRCVTWQTGSWWSISAGPSTSQVGPPPHAQVLSIVIIIYYHVNTH